MLCQNILKEHNNEVNCWLPINPHSPFAYCNRCDYEKVESILQNPQSLENYYKNQQFCILLHKKEHFDSLFNALSFLCKTKATFFVSLFQTLNIDSIKNALSHLTYKHSTPSARCSLYQYAIRNRNIHKNMMLTEFPWNCSVCLTKTLRSKNLKWYRAFSNGIIQNKLKHIHFHKEELIDCMVSLSMIQKDYSVRLLFERYSENIENEEYTKEVLQEFLYQPSMLKSLFEESESGAIQFIPYVWNSADFIKETQKKALNFIKKRNYVFKEELMIKTWAPHRLFRWCFDIEELKEFDPI
jgi:hypothetical protein